MRKDYIFILLLLLAMTIQGQEEKLQEKDKGDVSFSMPTYVFFKDNEYIGQEAYGYTLPGVRVKPMISYQPLKNLSISIGVSALKYWGADIYPCYNYVSVPRYSDTNTQKGFHHLPFFRVDYQMNSNSNLILGNIINTQHHYLSEPLFNEELVYTQDDEEGVQWLYNSTYLDNDLWLNWQNFNFYNDVDREAFLLGISGRIKPINKKISVSIPYSFLWQHHGGELDTVTSKALDHWTNGSLGLTLSYNLNKRYLSKIIGDFSYFYSKDLKNDTWRFPAGHAFFPSLTLENNNCNLKLGYYYSKDMISFYGNAFFSNLAQRNSRLTYKDNKLLYLALNYNVLLSKDYSLGFLTQWYYKFGSTLRYDMKEGDKISFSFGIVLKANPKFNIYKVKE